MKRKYTQCITLILSIIGAMAWAAPYFYELMRQPVIKGRLVGLTHSEKAEFSTYDFIAESIIKLEGIGYYPKLVLTSLNSEFNVKKVEVYVTYTDESRTYNGRIFYAPEIIISFKPALGKERTSFLHIPPTEHISLLTVLERSMMTPVWIPFIIDKATYSTFDHIEFRFFDFDNNSQSVIVRREQIDPANIIFEEKYWKDFSTENKP